MPRVADLPPGWRHWSPARKIEHLLGMSLDRAHEILSRRVSELDAQRPLNTDFRVKACK